MIRLCLVLSSLWHDKSLAFSPSSLSHSLFQEEQTLGGRQKDRMLPTPPAGLKPLLAALPATACQIEAQGQPRVGRLISALLANGIDSRSSLKAAWAMDASLLKAELAAWMQKGRASELVAAWPTLQRECREHRSVKKAKRRAT